MDSGENKLHGTSFNPMALISFDIENGNVFFFFFRDESRWKEYSLFSMADTVPTRPAPMAIIDTWLILPVVICLS